MNIEEIEGPEKTQLDDNVQPAEMPIGSEEDD